MALHQLVQLHTHQPCHCRRGRGYGRDDPPSNELTLGMRERRGVLRVSVYMFVCAIKGCMSARKI